MHEGGKLPFLFLHGAGGSKAKWRNIHDYLENIPYQCLDLPGHGENSEARDISVQQYASSISDLIDHDVIVVGHSMGGLIGIELAARNEHVKGLILLSSHYRMPVDATILQALKENGFPDSLFYVSYNKNFRKELLEEEKKELLDTPVETFYYDYMACNEYTDGKKVFSTLSIPILAIYGGEDRLLPEGAKESILRENPLAEILNIEECRHYAMLENPEHFTNSILHFRKNILKSQLNKAIL